MQSDDWATPLGLYRELDNEFHFNDDPCPLQAKGKITDGLERDWGTRTFVNPPYSNPLPWVRKAIAEARRGKLVVMLLKSDTSTRCFHDYILPYAEIRYLRGRLKFSGTNGVCGRAPFPSLVAVFQLTMALESMR